MKKRLGFWLVMGLGLVLVGCLPSVYPFYTEKDLVDEPALVGSWRAVDANDKEKWTFEKVADLRYKAKVVDSETNIYSVHLFKLKEQLFMDVMLVQEKGWGIPPHYLMKVAELEPHLKLALMNYEWVTKFLGQHPEAVRYTTVLDNPNDTNSTHVVLTAETKDLQKFIVAQMGNTNFFGDTSDMVREGH